MPIQEDHEPLAATPSLGELVEGLRAARAELDRADEAFHTAQSAVVDHIKALGQKTASYSQGAVVVRATVVQAERVVVDEPALKKALGARVFNKLTVRKLSNELLRKAIMDSVVDPVVVAQHSRITYNAPSVRISESVEDA